jgi:ribokinase
MIDRRFISFGSLNVDLNVRVPRFPVAGETVTGGDFFVAFGGKGAETSGGPRAARAQVRDRTRRGNPAR